MNNMKLRQRLSRLNRNQLSLILASSMYHLEKQINVEIEEQVIAEILYEVRKRRMVRERV